MLSSQILQRPRKVEPQETIKISIVEVDKYSELRHLWPLQPFNGRNRIGYCRGKQSIGCLRLKPHNCGVRRRDPVRRDDITSRDPHLPNRGSTNLIVSYIAAQCWQNDDPFALSAEKPKGPAGCWPVPFPIPAAEFAPCAEPPRTTSALFANRASAVASPPAVWPAPRIPSATISAEPNL